MISRSLAAFGIAAALVACRAGPVANVPEPATAPAAAPARIAPSGLAWVSLEIESGGRSHAFTGEVAATPDQQTQGLVFRETLGRTKA